MAGALSALNMKGLRARARAVGAGPEAMEDAADSDDPRSAYLALVQRLDPSMPAPHAAGVTEQEACGEHNQRDYSFDHRGRSSYYDRHENDASAQAQTKTKAVINEKPTTARLAQPALEVTSPVSLRQARRPPPSRSTAGDQPGHQQSAAARKLARYRERQRRTEQRLRAQLSALQNSARRVQRCTQQRPFRQRRQNHQHLHPQQQPQQRPFRQRRQNHQQHT